MWLLQRSDTYYLMERNQKEKKKKEDQKQYVCIGSVQWSAERYKIIFLMSLPKHMLWVLKRTVSKRRFF